jgi:predicted neuraminidase
MGAEKRTNNRQYEYPYLMQGGDELLYLAFAYQTRRGVKWMRFL